MDRLHVVSAALSTGVMHSDAPSLSCVLAVWAFVLTITKALL